MKPTIGARIFSTACLLLFIAAVVGLRWGVKISIHLMQPAQRLRADTDLLRAIWINRSILLFVLCAVCGVLGIFFSLRASDVTQR
jgi:hypothetical protein